jgi:sugar phosphate isomerase/epimerase
MNTRTRNFPIGFRRSGSAWQRDLPALLQWARDNGLSGVDLGRDADQTGQRVLDAGLRIGSADLKEWQGMISPDRATRQRAVETNAAYIRQNAALGPINYFVVMLPEKPELPRAENFGYMVESFAQLAPVLEAAQARIVIEGWPGPGALCCTPEGYRAFFKAVPARVMGVNYDPSHLVRMGIDHVRFLSEFAVRVYHVHGKDTELDAEALYDFGHEQPPTFARPVAFGGMTWRYTIPGHGQVRWVQVMRILAEHHYQGMISVELEDANFSGTPEAEQQGILLGANFLAGC